MRKRTISVAVLACFLCASLATADVTLTQRNSARRAAHAGKKREKAIRPPKVDARVDAQEARRVARTERGRRALGEGGITLIDSSGLKWFLNTNITFSTSSNASAAMHEANYTTSGTVTTSGGGTTSSTLSDAYDGYQSMCISLTGATGPCTTVGGGLARVITNSTAGNAVPYIFYNQTGGPPVADATCNNRQYVFPPMVAGGIQMQRKVFVPSTDSFARWLNIFTNVTGSPITFNMITSNNLGSDSGTLIVTSSSGNAAAEVTDTWVTTFQNYSSSTSTDPRLGHVFQGPGAAVGLAGINFADGNDGPYWYYTITLGPGQTKTIMNFGVAELTKAAAAAKSDQLARLTVPNVLACMSLVEAAQVANFNAQFVVVPTLGPAALAALGLALAVIGFAVVRRLF